MEQTVPAKLLNTKYCYLLTRGILNAALELQQLAVLPLYLRLYNLYEYMVLVESTRVLDFDSHLL